MKDIKEFYKRHNFLIRILALILPVTVLFFGCIFWKGLFWDNFLWKYYWGSIVSDAENRIINGAGSEYNIVNTITYGVILAISLFIIYKIFIKLSLKIDGKFFISISPFIILGPVLRVMEDADFFNKPFVYLFISPFIYIFLGILVFSLVIIGYYVDKIRKTKIMNYVVFMPGFAFLCVSAYLLSSMNWKHPNAVMFILCITVVASIASFLIFFLMEKKYKKLYVYILGPNILLFFAHFLDASATFVGTDFYNYAEKHPLPAFLINLSGTGAVMFPLKFILIFLVIYVLDITYKKEIKDISRKNQKFFLKSYGKKPKGFFPKILGICRANSVIYQENAESVFRDKTLTGLLKICIFILGLAPGVRDMLRIGIGV